MIKKIISIKLIRNFLNFESDVEFKKKNIIYAPNGTGKTNLSRLLLNLKNSESIDSFKSQEATSGQSPQFSIECNDENLNETNYQSKNISLSKLLVFNSDYIEETIKISNFSELDVSGNIDITVGKESNEVEKLEIEIKDKESNRAKTYNDLKKLFESSLANKKAIQDYSANDRNIWLEFKFEKLISSKFVSSSFSFQVEYDTCEEKLKELKNIDENNSIIKNNPDLVDSSSINFGDLIDKLKEPKYFQFADKETQHILNKITIDWLENDKDIKLGVEASKEANKCLLCQRDLDEDVKNLFSKYELVFKNEESVFKNELKNKKKVLLDLIAQLDSINNDKESDVNSMCSLLNLESSWTQLNTSNLIIPLKSLVSAIDSKIENIKQNQLNDSLKTEEFNDELDVINKALKANNDLIFEINKKIKDTANRKAQLRGIIGKKWLFEFYVQEKSKFKSINTLNEVIIKLKEKLSEEKSKLPTIDVLSNLIRVANYFLGKYLCLDSKYKFDDSNGKVVIKLKETNISSETKEKISEGEKTMLSLCYFMASSIRVLNKVENFKEAIFVIDDPVNSTSYNYLFGIGFLLKLFDNEIAKIVWPENNFQNGYNIQKIILTHNTPLFNLLKLQVFKEPGKKNGEGDYIPKHGYFLMTDSGFKELQKDHLKSEFEISLLAIKKAFKSENDDLVIGNDIRKVLETIKHFYGMKGSFDAAWLEKVFVGFDILNHSVFFGVINYYSHGNLNSHEDPLSTNFKTFLKQFDELIRNSLFRELWDMLDN